jgi:hypothetical protein
MRLTHKLPTSKSGVQQQITVPCTHCCPAVLHGQQQLGLQRLACAAAYLGPVAAAAARAVVHLRHLQLLFPPLLLLLRVQQVAAELLPALAALRSVLVAAAVQHAAAAAAVFAALQLLLPLLLPSAAAAVLARTAAAAALPHSMLPLAHLLVQMQQLLHGCGAGPDQHAGACSTGMQLHKCAETNFTPSRNASEQRQFS